MAELSTDDIRAAVAAGVIDEAQAARLAAIAHDRAGYRTAMTDDDEPFELFKGFAEVFVTVGLALLTSGIVGLSLILGNPMLIPVVGAGVSWLFARYFTLKRRMTLPSIFLTSTFGFAVFVLAWLLLVGDATRPGTSALVLFTATAAGLALWFRAFRVPFTMFLIGACGLGFAYAMAALLRGELAFALQASTGWENFLDLGRNPLMATTMLLFGFAAFLGAMVFDLRDPHRVSRHAASAFWLHILAAPAIVNVVAVSLLGIGGTAGYLLATAALLLITAIALIIDRRSFLTAGIIYIGVILTWALSATDTDEGWSITLTLLLMGAFITATGTWWAQARCRLMTALPGFPGKDRLPPWSD